ncbi:MAG TPA: hypothetical protein VFA01_04815 [Candidatus Dormibacteraeota bacterium]|nr:hypothetical protein [Candidatus Dormibacteraeota bacterium]
MSTFERSSGYSAIVVGVTGFLYSVSFVLNLRGFANLSGLVAFLLLAGGILSVQVLSALYRRTRDVDAGFALTALLFGFGGALAAALHGGYDLANVFHPPASAATDIPNAIDPRGLGTFGFAGIAILTFARLIQRGSIVRTAVDLAVGGVLPRSLAILGYVSGALLVVIYLGRLIVFEPNSPLVLAPAAIEGLIVNPAFYIWLGLALVRGRRA